MLVSFGYHVTIKESHAKTGMVFHRTRESAMMFRFSFDNGTSTSRRWLSASLFQPLRRTQLLFQERQNGTFMCLRNLAYLQSTDCHGTTEEVWFGHLEDVSTALPGHDYIALLQHKSDCDTRS